MKKIVSALALCVVLFGAVMMVTGCGSKPSKGSVWKMEKITAAGVSIPIPGETYLCFHSDGNAYQATKLLGLTAVKLGTYTIDNKNITIGSNVSPYTLKGEKMTVKPVGITGIPSNAEVELQKVTTPTEKEIADAAH